MKLFGHPVHPMLVHAPMGLLLTAPLWDVLGAAGVAGPWWAVACASVALGAAAAVPAAIAGFVDFAALEEGSPAERPALWHMSLMLLAVSSFATTLVFRRLETPTGAGAIGTIALDVLGLIALAAGGYFGGELVYRHGVGTRKPGAA